MSGWSEHPHRDHGDAATVVRGASARDWLSAIDAITEPVLIHDEDYCIVAANCAYARRAGMPPERFLGRPYWEVFPRRAGPLPGCQAAMHRRHERDGRARESQDEITLPSGEVFISRSFAVLDEDGAYRQSIHIFEDITERRQREAELAEAEARTREREHQLDRVLSNTAEGILVIDAAGDVVYANSTAGQLMGVDPYELLGEAFGFPVTTEDPEELELHTRTNGARVVEMRARSMRWEGAPAFVINLHDITERKRVERELRQSAIVFEEAQEGIIITDAELCTLAVNRAFREITGYTEAEVHGEAPRFLGSDHHSAAFFDSLWRSVREQGYWTGELWNRRRDGDTFPTLTTIRELRDETGGVTHYIAVFSDISRVKEYQNQIERVMHLDPLTELPNRMLFHDRLEQALRGSTRGLAESVVAVMVIDLNDFRSINDSLGHGVGDEILRTIGDRLASALDETATVARLSGDEFGVLMPQLATADDAAGVAERLIAAAEAPLTIDEHRIPISVRIGLSIYPDQASSANTLLEQADAAMYEAKSEGVEYRFFSEELTERARERVQLSGELRRALSEGELTLHYQPQIALAGGEWVGLEALLRWPHPTHGDISPGRFIPVAERSGLMNRLGSWVLTRACADFRALLDAGQDYGRIAVNITAPELAEADFVDRVLATLRETGLPPERLELEITESLLVNTDAGIIERLDALRSHGISVAVDDFGTGYSALSYLKDLPVDRLKIDRSFIDGLGEETRGSTITHAILALGHSLGLEVTAEGIEHPEQHDILREAGCEMGQGFLFARPVPLSSLREPPPEAADD